MTNQNNTKFYSNGIEYWNKMEPNSNSMLGGYVLISELEARSSGDFIRNHLETKKLKPFRACDCGAGIGRVSELFLLLHFKYVDLVEPVKKFLIEAEKNFKINGNLDRVEFINLSLQDFIPKVDHYDLIWCQWVLGHLTDIDLIKFLKRCKNSKCSYIGIKENVSLVVDFDSVDSSFTRTDYNWKCIFENAGLVIFKEEIQKQFPAELFQVKMYLLK